MTELCAALDFPSWREAEPFARAVSPHVALFKVGLELFTAEGPAAVREAASLGRPIFLDLKLHDIPNTVEFAMRSAVATGAAMVTVHAGGGSRMIEAALRGANGQAQVLAVTVLTSLDDADLSAVGLAGPAASAVERLAKLAVGAGANGIVCSPREVAAVRAAVGAKIKLVVPGIRPAGSEPGDQARAATPEAAAHAGADIIVIGRPLRDAPDPAAAAKAIAAAVGKR